MAPDVRSSPLALAVLSMLEIQPLHPYAIQRLIREWGKEQVVNVGQRATLYKVFVRLEEAGLIVVHARDRDQRYPDRTVYSLTGQGRETSRRWLEDMLVQPRNEFPRFPAALSFAALLDAPRLGALLRERAERVRAELADLEREMAAEEVARLPRINLIEIDYLRTVKRAQLTWLEATAGELLDGSFVWDREELRLWAVQAARSDSRAGG